MSVKIYDENFSGIPGYTSATVERRGRGFILSFLDDGEESIWSEAETNQLFVVLGDILEEIADEDGED